MNSRLRIIVPAALGSLLALSAVPAAGSDPGPGGSSLSQIKHIVVIYQENHSFDNLFGGWEGVNGRAAADAAHTLQVKQDGTVFTCLLQNDVNLSSPPQPADCADTTGTPANTAFSSHFANAPFQIDAFVPSNDTTCPPPGVFAANGVRSGSGLTGGCTRDLVHRFYQEQYQLDGGRQDRYPTGSDAVGLTQGVYNTQALPVYQFLHQPGHPSYAIADNFFEAALGGSFLNHQWLVAAATPVFAGAPNDGGPNDLHSVVDANGMPTNSPLYSSPLGANGGAANPGGPRDQALTASCDPPDGRPQTPDGVACGDFAINTIQPFNQPFSPGTPVARRLPVLTTPTIGDRLSANGIDWAWYSGGWSNADGRVGDPGWTNGNGPACSDPKAFVTSVFPNCPDKLFQFHHQAFAYYAAYAPGTDARAQHLRDEAEFFQVANSSVDDCNLKPVSFIKPIGEDNEHPGYTGESQGSMHLVQLLNAVESSACKDETLVIATYDEFGGQWDHVPPPGQGGASGPHDRWGPGTRIPAVIITPGLPAPFVVDSVQHDTTSILATIEHRFNLEPLGERDAAVNDLFTVFRAGSG